ncbi:motility associated factor glycosyltransferase family protein [Pseudoalteromonas umbrosa]|uniref:motility associated factor glycosyltransferase family protein n=1 Tax=Pseudoalteromonas umbrosa TaxID=3048489 RepID=UPI0024C2999F|nr:6-hydroxymethylpterin diphosphokinase MptE-like protein [Pseudoalteromonas sp. B95]MDK1287664.1 DUF115 domain-containing protein [Pseudoalteromonas sp. B95]
MELFNKNLDLLKRCLPSDFIKTIESVKQDDTAQFEFEFYGAHAKRSCHQQVELFLRHPTHLSLSFSSSTATEFSHQKCINNLNSIADEMGRNSNSKPQRGTLVVLGLGSGHHVTKLMSKIRYTDIVIVESDPIQYALASQYICFSSLQNECDNRGGSLNFIQVNSYTQFLHDMRGLIDVLGAYLLSDMSVFRHYNSPLMDSVFGNFKQWRNSFASMWGYLEDELIGWKHTQENRLTASVQGHKNVFSHFSNYPIYIVGNGPSLDNDIAKLSTITESAVIVSCGTSMGALLKADISPDFHIEMERSVANYYLKEGELNDPRNKDIVLIALSTVYPKLMSQFDRKIVFAKANDLGTEFAKAAKQTVEPLLHCNPTVTNMAVSAFIRMGFKNLVLLGCDYGYVDSKNHHSKLSGYYEPDSQLSQAKFADEMSVKGNFRDFVHTSRIFNEARGAQEKLLGLNPQVTVLNASDGAFIRGTKPVMLTEIEPCNKAKSHLMSAVFDYTNQHTLSSIDSGQNFAHAGEKLQELKSRVLDAPNIVAIIKCISQFVLSLKTDSDSAICKILLSGSLKYVVATIASHLNHLPLQKWNSYEARARNELNSLLDDLIYKLTIQ